MEWRIEQVINELQTLLGDADVDETRAIALWEKHCDHFADAMSEEDFRAQGIAELILERENGAKT